MSDKILECQDLSFSYEESISFQFNFSAKKGEFIGIIGKSGSGKSTFFSLISGFLDPSSGSLKLDGKYIENEPPSKRDLSILFQSHNLFPHLTVFQNVALGLTPKLRLKKEEKEEVFAILEELELLHLEKRQVMQLSGGQMQKVGLARCLLRKKQLLLLDEPFSSLDPSFRAKVHELLYEKSKERGLSVLFITHFPEEIRPFADAFALIENQEIQCLTAKDAIMTARV